MAEKQALNATFFAFRKRDKAVLLPATIAYVVVAFALFGLFWYFNQQAIADYIGWYVGLIQQSAGVKPGEAPSPEMMMPPTSVMALGPSYLLLLLVSYILLAAWEAACLRWMIHGETGGVLGLSLGADTWRVYFTYWVWLLLLVAFYIVLLIVGVGVGVGVGMAASGGGQDVAGSMGIFALVLSLAILAGLTYFGVRFAPAAATSIARRRFAFFDAWTVTKGRFWPLLGSFALLFLMYFVGIILLFVIAAVAIGMGMAGQTSAAPTSPEEMFAMLAAPQFVVPIAVGYGLMIIGVFMFYIALFGVNARAAQAALEEGKIQVAT